MHNFDHKHKLAAFLSADVVGYSRLMANDEVDTVRMLTACRTEMIAAVNDFSGRVVDFVGDNMLAEFTSTIDAVQCGLNIQTSIAGLNEKIAVERRMYFRIGIHLGEVMINGEEIYGDGVNIASRLEGLAETGGICISEAVYVQVRNKMTLDYTDLGEQKVKNIPDPVHVYRLSQKSKSTATKQESIAKENILPLPDKPSLAILPFVNLSADPEQDYFADGLTIDLNIALVKIPGLFLISDVSMFSFKAKSVSIQDLGRQLGVGHVLEGGVQKAGDRVRITARLIETAIGRQIWAESYDREIVDLFDVQDEITEKIVTALDVELFSGESAIILRKTFRNTATLESYYRGWEALFGTTKEDIREAQEMFEETIRLEPDSPMGYALAAWSHWWAVFRGMSDDAELSLERAIGQARKAKDLNDITGLPHLMMAQIDLLKREYDRALIEVDQAVLARPNCDLSYAAKANILNYLGRPAEAIELAKYAIRLTPVYPFFYPVILATAYYLCGQYTEAIAEAEKILLGDRENLDALLILCCANSALGRMEQAEKTAAEIMKVKPAFAIQTYAESQPYKSPEILEQMIRELTSAGLS